MTEPLADKYAVIYETLNAAYGRPVREQPLDPVDELVVTILSQSTASINTWRGYNALKARYPDWLSIIEAPTAEVVETIRVAGLANQKGPRIQEALRTILRERGEISLDFLSDMPFREAQAWLTRIHGVGRKTAAIVLLFSLGMPAFPVDTHVHRITGRLGLIPPRTSADKAHDILESLGEPDSYYPFHINLIRHGREVCRARTPLCERCPIVAYCDYYRSAAADRTTQ